MKTTNNLITSAYGLPSLSVIKDKLAEIVKKVANFVKTYGSTMFMGLCSGGAIASAVSSGSLPIIGLGALTTSAFLTIWDWKTKSAVNDFLDRTDPNRDFKTAAAVKLNTFINKLSMEKGMKNVILVLKDMKINSSERVGISAYDILLEIFKNDKDFLSSEIDKGLVDLVCRSRYMGHGQANVLLNWISNNPNANSAELLQAMKDDSEAVSAFQILAVISSLLLQKMRTEQVIKVVLNMFSRVPQDQNNNFEIVGGNVGRNKELPEETRECFKEISIKTYNVPSATKVFLSDSISISEISAENIQKNFEDATVGFPKELIVSGKIELIDVCNARNEASENAIWFQCSEGKYRFYDGSMYDQGLFEFPNIQEFYKGLKKQLDYQRNCMGQQKIRICIYGINKT